MTDHHHIKKNFTHNLTDRIGSLLKDKVLPGIANIGMKFAEKTIFGAVPLLEPIAQGLTYVSKAAH